jgi:hypothetical protein
MVNSLRACAILAALLGAQAPLAAAHGGAHGHREGGAPLAASAAFDAEGGLWAASLEDRRLVLRRSTDFGRSWSAPRMVVDASERVAAEGDARPKLAAGPAGEIYLSWTRPLSKPYTGEIRFSRSLDGGRSFSAPFTVHTDRQEITHRFDALAVARDGRVFLVWIDKRDQEAALARGLDYRGAAVYYAVSDDRGASFRGDFKVADHSCECCRIALAPLADGNVAALWRHVFAPNVRDHALAVLAPDGRALRVRRATFDHWRVDACPHHGPSLGVDSAGRLHAVWFTGAAGREGVHYGRLLERGVGGERRVGGESAAHADLAISGTRVALTWKEFDGARSRLRAMVSEDGGEHWREMGLAVTDGASDQPRALAWRGRFFVFWNTQHEPLSVRTLP